jgi:hypothetical protein
VNYLASLRGKINITRDSGRETERLPCERFLPGLCRPGKRSICVCLRGCAANSFHLNLLPVSNLLAAPPRCEQPALTWHAFRYIYGLMRGSMRVVLVAKNSPGTVILHYSWRRGLREGFGKRSSVGMCLPSIGFLTSTPGLGWKESGHVGTKTGQNSVSIFLRFSGKAKEALALFLQNRVMSTKNRYPSFPNRFPECARAFQGGNSRFYIPIFHYESGDSRKGYGIL